MIETEAGHAGRQDRIAEQLHHRVGSRGCAENLNTGHPCGRVEVPDRHRVGVRWQGARQHGRQQQ